jgi:KUP system potassium uptake protein
LVCTRKYFTEPYKTEYKVTEIIKDDLYRIDFNLGFREPTKINLMFKEVIKDMVKKGEVDITSRYESLNKNNIIIFICIENSF